MRASHLIVLASNNHDKLREFQSLLKFYPSLEIRPASDYIRNSDKIGLVEKFDSYAENAIAKARFTNHAAHYPALADDSGLEVEALSGRPGVKSHRYATPKASVTQDQANIQKLLEELKGRPMSARGARFVCELALEIEGILIQGHGVLEGAIAEAPVGSQGFGYDPIFIPKGSNKSLAQISAEEKNEISHRARAFHDLMNKVKTAGITFARP